MKEYDCKRTCLFKTCINFFLRKILLSMRIFQPFNNLITAYDMVATLKGLSPTKYIRNINLYKLTKELLERKVVVLRSCMGRWGMLFLVWGNDARIRSCLRRTFGKIPSPKGMNYIVSAVE